jgi:hypothetical protein
MNYPRLAKILGPIILVGLVLGYIWHLQGDAAKWRGRVYAIADVIQEVGDFKGRSKGDRAGKLGYKDLEKGVRKIGADRDRNARERDAKAAALNDQTALVLELSRATLAARQEADRQTELARQLTVQRDTWIKRARTAATRKERLSADVEAQQMEEALDALRDANF